jgi:phage terminase large subunit
VAANDVGEPQSVGRVGNYWHMLPQANQARKALWEAVNPHTGKKRIDEAFPHAIRAASHDQEMLIRFKSGSTWQVVGSDNFNSLVGSPPIGLVFSEWPLCDPASWAYLMPIIEENNGWVIFNGTPRGKNHAYRSIKSAQKNERAFGEILSAEKTGIFSAAQLAKIRQELIDVYGDEYGESIYEQEYLVSFEAANLGAILGRGLAKAERQGRINDRFDYDPDGAPIEISSDIGRRDASSWWFWQPCVGGYRIVDFDKDSGLDADEWCDRLEKRILVNRYKVGKVWLPHDAKAKTFSAKHSAVEIFLGAFGNERVRVVPDSTKQDRINAARRVLNRCSFHTTKTEKGRDGLSAWSYVYDEERKEFSKEPDHNWASHDGDAFSYGALVLEEHVVEVKKEEPMRGITVGAPSVTLNEMWATAPQPTGRI